MKLKLSEKYGQRDSRWGSIILGYNTEPKYNIANYGCLLTCFSIYIAQSPDKVNQLLKDNGGFASGGGDFIWNKCAVLGLKEVYKSPFYSSAVTDQGITKMKELLNEGRPLICHIDFDPHDPDDDEHWLIIFGVDDSGEFIAHDPWSDTDISLSVYGGVRRAVYEWHCYDKILEKEDGVPTVTIGVTEYDELKLRADLAEKVSTKLNVGLSEAIIMPELDKLIAYEDAVVQKDKLLTDAQGKINQFQKEVETKGKQIETMKKQVETLTNDIETAGKQNETMSGELKILKEQCNQPVLTGWKKWLYDWIVKQRG